MSPQQYYSISTYSQMRMYNSIQKITIMNKRSVTPINKDKPVLRNTSNPQKAFKDIRNAPIKQVLSRNPSNSKISFPTQYPFSLVRGVNPESPDQMRHRESGKKPLVSQEMRFVVVQWMLQISHSAHLRRQTIFMAVHLFDAILLKLSNVSTSNLQLVAITAFFIAAKYEEIYPQNLNKFIEYTARSYSKHELLRMQERILGEMDFKLTFPTRITHFGLIPQANQAVNNSQKYQSLCLFLLELSLLTRWQNTKDEDIAQAASFLAKKVLNLSTGWKSDIILQIAYKMMGLWRENAKSVLAYFYDNQKHSFVGGIKLIY